MMVNHFVDKTKFSLIGSANNVNDQGFSGGGGGPRWRRNNGLVATKTLGANFAAETSKLDIGGSARYNYRGADIISTNLPNVSCKMEIHIPTLILSIETRI